MPWPNIRVALRIITLVFSFTYLQLSHYLTSLKHRFTYTLTPHAQNIIIIGGSFTGLHLARRLAQSIPTGYRLILIEKNTHFNYLFNFPRYSVLKGKEGRAFIPYDGLKNVGPKGILEVVRGEVVSIEEGNVVLDGGEKVGWAYLAIATGSRQNLPAQVRGTTREEGRRELRGLQERIAGAKRVCVVGGGAVGVQLVGDIKSWYPEKDVTLVHSRERLLSSFGGKLGRFVEEKLRGMGIQVVLGERPEISGDLSGAATLRFKNGEIEAFDLVIPCTGQTPNSSLLSTFSPGSICPKTGRILVKPSLQILDPKSPSANPNIFALGDVAETFGAKMARAGMMQAEVVAANILDLISRNKTGKQTTKEDSKKIYKPDSFEGSLKLSLGKDATVMYFQDGDDEFLFSLLGAGEDLSIKQGWWMNGVSTKNWDA